MKPGPAILKRAISLHSARRETAPVEAPLSAAAELERLARAVGRLIPDRRDPEKFHVDRSEIVGELRRLARATERREAH